MDLLGNTRLLQQVKKLMICDWWISIRFVTFSVFHGSLLVIVMMINGSEKRNCEGGF